LICLVAWRAAKQRLRRSVKMILAKAAKSLSTERRDDSGAAMLLFTGMMAFLLGLLSLYAAF